MAHATICGFMQPGRERQLVTAAVMLGLFLAALEATAVAAAVQRNRAHPS